MTAPLPTRAAIGFLAAALAVITFHQGMIGLLYVAKIPGLLVGAPPYPMRPIPPLGIPATMNLMFWGGLYGLVFGLLAPRFRWPLWLCGLLTGILASLVGMFVVAAIKGNPVGGGWNALNWARSFLINGSFGLGLGLIFPRLIRLAR
jgi:hypothetical protein